MAQQEKIKREVTERKKILLNYERVLCLHFPGSHGNRRKGRLYRQFEVVKKNKGQEKERGYKAFGASERRFPKDGS